MIIKNNLLKADPGETITQRKSPNIGGAMQPDTIVIHYTAGRDAESACDSLCNPANRASAHVVIARNGAITQLVPFNIVAWHAGKSSYGGRTGFNGFSIGIELDNAGVLTKSGNSYVAWFGRAYGEQDVIQAVHRNETTLKYWHRYTEEQIVQTQKLCELLIQTFKITSILGHEEIAPVRKIDPGPAFPLDKLRDKLLHPQRDEEEGEGMEFPIEGSVIANLLNVRSNPGSTFSKVTNPLPRGTKVKILDEKNGWYKIAIQTTGWVAKDFVDIIK
jgi:N-acetylmuramoyl-L-alanine amidase